MKLRQAAALLAGLREGRSAAARPSPERLVSSSERLQAARSRHTGSHTLVLSSMQTAFAAQGSQPQEQAQQRVCENDLYGHT